MGDQNRNLSTFEKLAIGAGLGIGALLGYKYMTASEDPERHSEVAYETQSSGGSSQDENIRVIENTAELRRSIREINVYCREFGVLGFDCEYETSYGQQPSAVLLQLQTYQGLCVLIRLPLLESIPEELKELLRNDQILKVGVGPDDDSNHLHRKYNLTVKGTVDLRYMAAQSGCEPGTLAKMSEKYLGLKLKKGSDKALNFDWNKPILSEKQIEYAAKDAHAAIELFKFFVEKLFEKRHSTMYFVDKKTRVNTVISECCTKFMNKHYNGAQGFPREMIYDAD